MSVLLFKELTGTAGRVGEELLLSQMYSWKNRTERLNILLGGKGNCGQVVSMSLSASPAAWAQGSSRREQSCARSAPQTPGVAAAPHSVCCGVATGVCGPREFLRHVGESSDTGGA